jgi:hypothetical protein
MPLIDFEGTVLKAILRTGIESLRTMPTIRVTSANYCYRTITVFGRMIIHLLEVFLITCKMPLNYNEGTSGSDLLKLDRKAAT